MDTLKDTFPNGRLYWRLIVRLLCVRLPSHMSSTDTAFEQILGAIEPPLSRGGFSKVEEETYPEAFGSRYATFGNGKEFIRLTWDGKEGWFVLESNPANSVTFEYGWIDILLQFFRPPEWRAGCCGDSRGYEGRPLCLSWGCKVAHGGSLTTAYSGRAAQRLS